MPPKPKAEQETAFVLDPAQVSTDVPVHFPGFPGVWTPGRPIAARELLDRLPDVDTVDDLKDHIAAAGLPLKVKLVDEGSAAMPRAETQLESEEEARTAQQPAAKPEPVASSAGEGGGE